MKTESRGYSGLEIITENDAEAFYLGKLLMDLDIEVIEVLNQYILIRLLDGCGIDHTLKELLIDEESKQQIDDCEPLVKSIGFHAFGI